MSTRGFIGFAVDGREIIVYNHWDSYPDALGLEVLGYLRGALAADPELFRKRVAALQVVTEDVLPTPEQVRSLRQWSWNAAQHGGGQDLRGGQQWYDLLHETQGDIGRILECGYAENNPAFPCDSLYAEWGYVIDLDGDGVLEAYQGFQLARHGKGRFADREPAGRAYPGADTYYPVALAAQWPLADLPSDEAFLAALREDDDDE